MNGLLLVISLLVGAYLLYATIRPERFEGITCKLKSWPSL
jgi:K+-transporting ATPase KdpF subunit